MEQALLLIVGGLLLALGFLGCVIPVLPGPALAYAALWTLVPFGATPPSTRTLVVGAIVLLVASLLDYVLPTAFAKTFKCSRWGVFGCIVGTVVGLFFLPIGLIAGPFIGTICGEIIAGKTLGPALRSGVGALMDFVASLVVKFATVALFAYWFLSAVLG
ncbi:MAG: DUF456 domain-containing protein [Kiritimatiellia bacterium]